MPADLSKSAVVDLRKFGNLEANSCQQIGVNLQMGGWGGGGILTNRYQLIYSGIFEETVYWGEISTSRFQ